MQLFTREGKADGVQVPPPANGQSEGSAVYKSPVKGGGTQVLFVDGARDLPLHRERSTLFHLRGWHLCSAPYIHVLCGGKKSQSKAGYFIHSVLDAINSPQELFLFDCKGIPEQLVQMDSGMYNLKGKKIQTTPKHPHSPTK